jgi:hypothetical protein
MNKFFMFLITILLFAAGGYYMYNTIILKNKSFMTSKPVSGLSQSIENAKSTSANTIAKSFAAYLTTAKSTGITNDNFKGLSSTIPEGTTVSFSIEGGESVPFSIPEHATMLVTGEFPQGGSVVCEYDGVKSSKCSW